LCRNTVSDEADVSMSPGTLSRSFGPAAANDRSSPFVEAVIGYAKLFKF